MEINEIVERFSSVYKLENSAITQIRHEEDDEFYRVWKIEAGEKSYIVKEAKGYEEEAYRTLLAGVSDGVPKLFQTVTMDDRAYLLMEYVEGNDLRRCSRHALTLTLDSLIAIQKETWKDKNHENCAYSFEKSLNARKNRGEYLNDTELSVAYELFLKVFTEIQRALCHDDMLPINVIVSEERAVVIDWEYAGILPYPCSFSRLIAHCEEKEDAFFFMTQEDREFAITYYYEK